MLTLLHGTYSRTISTSITFGNLSISILDFSLFYINHLTWHCRFVCHFHRYLARNLAADANSALEGLPNKHPTCVKLSTRTDVPFQHRVSTTPLNLLQHSQTRPYLFLMPALDLVSTAERFSRFAGNQTPS